MIRCYFFEKFDEILNEFVHLNDIVQNLALIENIKRIWDRRLRLNCWRCQSYERVLSGST